VDQNHQGLPRGSKIPRQLPHELPKEEFSQWIRIIKDILWAQPLPLSERGVRLDRVDRGGEKMESPPRLGLGTINIVPLWGRTDLTTRV